MAGHHRTAARFSALIDRFFICFLKPFFWAFSLLRGSRGKLRLLASARERRCWVPGGPTLGSSVTRLMPSPMGFPPQHQGPAIIAEVSSDDMLLFNSRHTTEQTARLRVCSPPLLLQLCPSYTCTIGCRLIANQ
ncbi:hypothetical protein EYF80_014597 [Liparis tanakae]|uniref:Uncharacterized protein n=1 Tax=Liparis tanakae TaxID=230148 RepID=A0A4Z2IB44_9TELE|nr:hypothetical protein EYF80_014597 [Liparis tanakae]